MRRGRFKLLAAAFIFVLLGAVLPNLAAHAAAPAVVESLTLHDTSGQPIVGAYVILSAPDDGPSVASGSTDSEGLAVLGAWSGDDFEDWLPPASPTAFDVDVYYQPVSESSSHYIWGGSDFVLAPDVEESLTFGAGGSEFVATLPLTLPPGSISGTVTTIPAASAGGFAANLVSSAGDWEGWVIVDEDGDYRFSGVPAGTYRLNLDGSTGTSSLYGYGDTWYGGSSFDDADDIPVGSGEVTGVDLTAYERGRVSGTLYEVTGGGALQVIDEPATIAIYPEGSSPSGDDARLVESHDGSYRVDVPAGTYNVAYDRFASGTSAPEFDAEQYYLIGETSGEATDVVVEAGEETLEIDAVFGATREPQSVFRFWSSTKKAHFYTISEAEKQFVIDNYDDAIWAYEGPAYEAYQYKVPGSSALYRFWSDRYQGHFYTANAAEKDAVIANYADDEWRYEGIAFYILPTGTDGATPVARFWSQDNRHHFYTADANEAEFVKNNYPSNVWAYEGTAFNVPAE